MIKKMITNQVHGASGRWAGGVCVFVCWGATTERIRNGGKMEINKRGDCRGRGVRGKLAGKGGRRHVRKGLKCKKGARIDWKTPYGRSREAMVKIEYIYHIFVTKYHHFLTFRYLLQLNFSCSLSLLVLHSFERILSVILKHTHIPTV